jgi:hypothetical protein
MHNHCGVINFKVGFFSNSIMLNFGDRLVRCTQKFQGVILQELRAFKGTPLKFFT